MNILETTALKWHLRSDHARDGAKFGSPTCNCTNVAKRMLPLLMGAWNEGFTIGSDDLTGVEDTTNPYWAAMYE